MQQISTTHKAFAIASGVVVSLYLSVALVAFFCATTHANHHGHQTTHSALCIWACQANNSVSLLSTTTPILPIFLAFVLFQSLLTPQPTPIRVFRAPRGPPRTSRSNITFSVNNT